MAVRTRGTPEETARRGGEIYERDIEPTLGADQHDRYVSIDVDSGNWAIGDTLRDAIDGLHERCPDAFDVWSLRVGHRAAVSFGGRTLRSTV